MELLRHIMLIVQNYENIVSDKDKSNFQTSLINLKDITSSLKNNINREIDKLDIMLNDFKVVTDKSDEISAIITELNNSSKSFSSAIEKLDNIFIKIENGDGTLGKLINDEILHNNINDMVSDIRDLIKDFKDNPTKYMKAYRKSKK